VLVSNNAKEKSARKRKGTIFVPYRTSVLVVDDHPHFRDLLMDLLRSAGIGKLYGAASGLEALELLETIEPTVVMTDWIMPKMDGLELCTKIRQELREPVKSIPIIMVTGNAKPSDLQMARDMGIDEFLAKPITIRLVLERLKLVIENPRPFVDEEAYRGPCRRRRAQTAFAGPWRREDDGVFVENADDPIGRLARAAVFSAVGKLAPAVASAREGDRQALLSIPPIVAEILSSAKTARDKSVARAGSALSRYIASLAPHEAPRVDVLETLANGLTVLVALDPKRVEQREEVAVGLERVLAKATNLVKID
jgi:two-component system, chemotaxis family, chemotaxis protein CheY